MEFNTGAESLPKSTEAERHVLGCCLRFTEGLNKVIESGLDVEDFFKRLHRQLFQTIIELESEPDRAVDLLTVTDALRNSPEGLSEADFGYILELRDDAVTKAGLESHIELVRDASTRRKIIETSRRLIGEALDGGDKTSTLLERAEDGFFRIAENRMTQEIKPLSGLVDDALDDIRAIHEKRATEDAVPTGFYDLDELLTVLHKSNLIILASRPGMGKTALGLNIAQRASIERGIGVGFFSLEMSAAELVRRMLCSEARINSHHVRSGRISDRDMEGFVRVAARMADAPFYIDDTAALTVMELRAKARRLVMQREVQLIVVDYLQLMTAPHRKPESRQVEVSEISRSLKQLAMELKVPVLAMAQLNRGVTARAVKSKIPQLSDLRESGAIEQDADVVMFLHREDYYKVGREQGEGEPAQAASPLNEEGVSQIIVAKQRNGPVGHRYLLFLKDILRFENLDPSYQPSPMGPGAEAEEEEPPF